MVDSLLLRCTLIDFTGTSSSESGMELSIVLVVRARDQWLIFNLLSVQVQLSKHVAVNSATAHPHRFPDGTVYNLGMSSGRGGMLYSIIKIPPTTGGMFYLSNSFGLPLDYFLCDALYVRRGMFLNNCLLCLFV